MPPMGPPGKGRNPGIVKPKDAKRTFTKILEYMGKNAHLLVLVFFMLILGTLCHTGASYWLKPILNDVEMTIKGSEDDDEDDAEFTVVKIGSKWYMINYYESGDNYRVYFLGSLS